MSGSSGSLASLTTMRVGGPAERILVARTREELVTHTLDLWRENEDWLLLGGGSNTVISDEGFPGTVLLVRSEGIEIVDDESLPTGHVRVRVQAGHDWDGFVATSVSRGWGGVEALSGIPGLVGAAPIQNIGAYGTELADTLHSIELLEESSGEVVRVATADLQLAYRDSALKRRDLEGVVLSVDLVLTVNEDDGDNSSGRSAPVRYDQLAQALDVKIGDVVSPRSVRQAVLALRGAKGMVLDVNDHDTWSSGSFFTNPIVGQHFARGLPDSAPKYPVDQIEAKPTFIPLEHVVDLDIYLSKTTHKQQVKLSAAWLIEQAGITKGFQLPGSGAAISSKHTLAITNRGNATAADVAELARYVIALVRSEFGVLLVPEPNLYGLSL